MRFPLATLLNFYSSGCVCIVSCRHRRAARSLHLQNVVEFLQLVVQAILRMFFFYDGDFDVLPRHAQAPTC